MFATVSRTLAADERRQPPRPGTLLSHAWGSDTLLRDGLGFWLSSKQQLP
jgi:hypothetical protein